MSATSKTHTETELKLLLSLASARSLADNPTIRARCVAAPRPRHEVTTYFDTPGEQLAQSGISLRIRAIDDGTGVKRVQTVKVRGESAVAASRGEWEWPIGSNRLDVTRLVQTSVADKLPRDLANHLRPIVTTEVDRTIRTLHLAGATVEASLDQGIVAAGDRHESIRELELELRDGEPGPLYRLALELHAAEPVHVTLESKAERGYRLLPGHAAKARKTGAIALDAKISAAEGLARIVTAGLAHLLVNQPAAQCEDAEGVHQMRVAIRQLRAALVLFGKHLEPHVTERVEAELRRLGQVFGAARDWDVYCLEILTDVFGDEQIDDWEGLLREPAAGRRSTAHAALLREMHAPPFTALVLGLAAWVEDGRTHHDWLGDDMQDPLADLVPQLLDRLAAKVDRRGDRIDDRSSAELHALRKSLKKLRYGIDFVQSLYPKKKVKAYLRKCKKLQDRLGAINDATTAIRLTQQLTQNGRIDLVAPLAAVARHVEANQEANLRDLTRRWAAFQKQKRFWN